MRKTACTDNKIVLFSLNLTCFVRTVAAVLTATQKRVPVYARFLCFGMLRAFPKRRVVCPVQQTFSRTKVKNLSKIRRFTIAYYDDVVISLKKYARLFPESV